MKKKMATMPNQRENLQNQSLPLLDGSPPTMEVVQIQQLQNIDHMKMEYHTTLLQIAQSNTEKRKRVMIKLNIALNCIFFSLHLQAHGKSKIWGIPLPHRSIGKKHHRPDHPKPGYIPRHGISKLVLIMNDFFFGSSIQTKLAKISRIL